MEYECTAPFVLDTSKYPTTFGRPGAPLATAVVDTLEGHRQRQPLIPANGTPVTGHVTADPGVLGFRRLTIMRVLSVMLAFGAVSALAGLIIAIPGGGAGFPLSALEGTPFTSFVVPGLLLGVVIGGTQLAASVAVARGRGSGPLLACLAGYGMLIWIFTELAMIGYSILQTVYFALGLVELILVLLLLGVIPPRRWQR